MCLASCAAGTYKETSTCTCDSCDDSCSTCSCADNDCCDSCDPDYLYRNTCVSTCPDGEWKNSVTHTCDNCMTQCATCTNSYECTTCRDDDNDGIYDLHLYNKDCVECPERYYGDNTWGICKSCHESCQTCTGALDS